jgi:1-aminocyclopropane-1-carboxylate deaminase/D-cysteine desulfhydrase-like pyridoxal-dependent ACC family enzyme
MLTPATIRIQSIEDASLKKQDVQWWIARLDEVHPIVSGNKYFKLQGFIEAFQQRSGSCLVTAGGAFSNHLAATAWYAHQLQIPCYGIIRGDYPKTGSHTLDQCKAWNMQLLHVSAQTYRDLNEHSIRSMLPELSDFFFIPSGGFDPLGTIGIASLWPYFLSVNPTHLTCSIGTGTTFAGLFNGCPIGTELIGIPALKGLTDFDERWTALDVTIPHRTPTIWNDAHWGGYAKKDKNLIDFMNQFFQNHGVPTDFVYTAKHFHTVLQKIQSGYFSPGSRILSLHTGGLQGNASLPANTLCFD